MCRVLSVSANLWICSELSRNNVCDKGSGISYYMQYYAFKKLHFLWVVTKSIKKVVTCALYRGIKMHVLCLNKILDCVDLCNQNASGVSIKGILCLYWNLCDVKWSSHVSPLKWHVLIWGLNWAILTRITGKKPFSCMKRCSEWPPDPNQTLTPNKSLPVCTLKLNVPTGSFKNPGLTRIKLVLFPKRVLHRFFWNHFHTEASIVQ